jgi:alkylated DNA repair dioxygenase AlkB
MDTNPTTSCSPDGLLLFESFISGKEESCLLQMIDDQEWHSCKNPHSKRTQHYGYIFNFKSRTPRKTKPIPQWLYFILDRLLSLQIVLSIPNQVIINEYQPGQGILPHVDNCLQFQDGICSLSLASDIEMSFLQASLPPCAVWLQRRSLLSIHGPARYDWKHGIEARTHDGCRPRMRRVSLTFRTIKE